MKNILPYGFLIFIVFSCTNYFNSTQKKIVDDDSSLQKIKLGKPLDSIEIYLFGDYHKYENDKKNIWIENNEFKKLLNFKLKVKPTEQVLFTFNNQPYFSNLFGFFYEDLIL